MTEIQATISWEYVTDGLILVGRGQTYARQQAIREAARTIGLGFMEEVWSFDLRVAYSEHYAEGVFQAMLRGRPRPLDPVAWFGLAERV